MTPMKTATSLENVNNIKDLSFKYKRQDKQVNFVYGVIEKIFRFLFALTEFKALENIFPLTEILSIKDLH